MSRTSFGQVNTDVYCGIKLAIFLVNISSGVSLEFPQCGTSFRYELVTTALSTSISEILCLTLPFLFSHRSNAKSAQVLFGNVQF